MRPTRCTSHSATIIDHVLTNAKTTVFESVIFTSMISDHFPIFHFCNFSKTKPQEPIYRCRNFSTNNINSFKQALNSINWNSMSPMVSPQDCYDYFSDIFSSLYNLYFPLVTKKVSKKFNKINPWMTNGLLTSRRQKIFLCKQNLLDPTAHNLSIYKNFRNLYAKLRPVKNSIINSNYSNIKQIAKKLGKF